MTMPVHPFYMAKEAQNMARHAKGTNAVVFEKVAMVSMCTVAVAAGMQVLLQLWRDLHRNQDKGKCR